MGGRCLPYASNYLFTSGVEVRIGSEQELAALIQSEMQKRTGVVKGSGARASGAPPLMRGVMWLAADWE
jgi:hypothetical protein